MFVSVELLLAWWVVWNARKALNKTTLISAWTWSLLALTLWSTTWTFDSLFAAVSSQMGDHLWYASALIALCPAISVLGSRRPGSRVWNSFIMLPMLLTLGWPVITLAFQGSELRGLQLETPQLVAFCLVLVMGVGNYVGTGFTLPALIYGASVIALVASMSLVAPLFLANREITHFWTTAFFAASILLARRTVAPPSPNCFDTVWLDFFDTFGIVWGRRIQDRVNFVMQKEKLPVKLDLHGFVWNDELAANAEVEARIEHALRWLLRRFVDPAWIDERLGVASSSEPTAMNVDS